MQFGKLNYFNDYTYCIKVGSFPFQITDKVRLFVTLGAAKLCKINVGQQVSFNVIDGFLKGLHEFLKIFLVQK